MNRRNFFGLGAKAAVVAALPAVPAAAAGKTVTEIMAPYNEAVARAEQDAERRFAEAHNGFTPEQIAYAGRVALEHFLLNGPYGP